MLYQLLSISTSRSFLATTTLQLSQASFTTSGRPLVSFPLDSDAGVTEDDPADDAPSPFGHVPAGEHEFDRL